MIFGNLARAISLQLRGVLDSLIIFFRDECTVIRRSGGSVPREKRISTNDSNEHGKIYQKKAGKFALYRIIRPRKSLGNN